MPHEPKTEVCPICGGAARLVYPDHPGYREGRVYAIFNCGSCNTSFAEPREPDAGVYELIYRDPLRVPGYDRYASYAEKLKHVPDPLGYLARREDVYWAVERYLEQKGTAAGARLLEFGSGLGYLTYALAKRGFDAVGLDISSVAVEKARARYGDRYICREAGRLAREEGAVYDAVFMLEIVEHLPDPFPVMSEAAALVKPGGDLVITTPNRSAYSPDVLWETDTPPVHIWWFTERAMEVLAGRLGMGLGLMDFTDYNRTHFLNVYKKRRHDRPVNGAVFDAAGNVKRGIGADALHRAAKAALRMWRKAVRMTGFALGLFRPGKRRGSLCAVFSKPAAQ